MSEQEPFTASRQALVDGRPPIVYTRCRLSVIAGPDAGQSVETEKDLIRVGQAADNDIVIRDEAVSRLHFELRRKKGEYVLADLDSTNGTYVGPVQIKEGTLRKHTEISVGDSTLLFEPQSTEFEVVPSGTPRLGEMVADSVEMRALFTVIERVAPTDLAILISGETGTGKELIARALHDLSRRKDQPFVTLACGSLPPALIESAMFGHEAGAMQGAERPYAGAFERAHRGTLLLDELGDLPIELQPRLLRAIERGEIQRLRGEGPIRVDVRVIAATHEDIKGLVDQQKFRADLYYRLAEIRMDVAPLRDRREDIPVIAEAFFERNQEALEAGNMPARRLGSSAAAQLSRYAFPGNVRELINILRRAAAMASQKEIGVSDLPVEVTQNKGGSAAAEGAQSVRLPDASMRFKDAKAQVLDAFERQYLSDLLARHEMNISKAAREAGIDRRHLYRLLDKYNIDIKDRPD